MNGTYSMEAVEEEQTARASFKESFKYVGDKSVMSRGAHAEQHEPSCGLSVSKISYTVR